MVEVVLLQISPSIRKALWVCMVNHHDGVMYAEHVLLHCLVLLLLDLIQCPYHGIIVALVIKRLLHVHQQVLHRDTLAFVQCPVCICQGTHRDWQKYEGTCLPHHIAQGRCPCRTARVCTSPLLLDQST